MTIRITRRRLLIARFALTMLIPSVAFATQQFNDVAEQDGSLLVAETGETLNFNSCTRT